MGKMAEKGEIVLYQPEGEVKLEVRVENETNSVVAKFATTTEDGKTYQVEHYDPDLTLSIGYRVKSSNGIKFRRWANQVLKDHLLKGYSISPRMMTVGMQVESRFRKQEKIIEAHSAQLDSHFGASFKDMGNEMTAYSVLNFVTPEEVIEKVKESVKRGEARF